MNQKVKDIFMIISVTILILVAMVINVFGNVNLIVSLVMLVIIAIFVASYILRYSFIDMEAYCNKLLVGFSQITKMIILAGSLIEYNFGTFSNVGNRQIAMFVLLYLMVLGIFVFEFVAFIKTNNCPKIKTFVLIGCLFLYIVFATTISMFWILIVGVTFLSSYTIYGNKKLIYFAAIVTNVINTIAVVKHIYSNNYLSDKHKITEYIIEIILMVVFTAILMNSSDLVRLMNDNKLDMAKKEEEKVNELAKQIMMIGDKVKDGVIATTEVVNKLDEAMNTTAGALENIVVSNENNTESIEEQKGMSTNIAFMMNGVVKEVKSTMEVAKKSLMGVENIKSSFDVIRDKSNNIVNNNKKVIKVIDEFVENAKNVKETTREITDISDETNLVSLNATIKSIKAGALGKGFEVVANEVYKLAQETTDLTYSINDIVKELEENAITAQQMVNEVVDAVKEENINIDYTAQDFIYVQRDILSLKNNINSILERANEMLDVNSNIEEHIHNLSDSTNEVASQTKEVVKLNDENIIKKADVRKLLNDLGATIERLERLQDSNS